MLFLACVRSSIKASTCAFRQHVGSSESASSLKPGRRFRTLQDVEDAVENFENSGRLPAVLFKEMAFVDGGVDGSHVFEHRRQGFGGIQVVVHALFKLADGFPRALGQFFVASRAEAWSRPDASSKSRSRSMLRAAAFKTFKGEIQLLAIRDGSQQVADRLRLVAHLEQIAQSIEVARATSTSSETRSASARNAARTARTDGR